MFLFRRITEEDEQFKFITGNKAFDELTPNGSLKNYIKVLRSGREPFLLFYRSIFTTIFICIFIDTGAAETVLDKRFAEELGVEIFFSRKGTFAGTKKASVQFGKLNSITLGEFTIKNLPIAILPVRHFSELVFDGTKVDGIIGTILFYHFITTMDYVEGELILRRKNKNNLSKID
ncbi:hypothetical protein LCGC14_2165030 [marine sediment metagenome]|uniref:Peptidase A2 domain-containing protein n=1 Tax=marine sediment metagenome TaxID=412755 RepID=A0A0F9GMU4_9ZZZZ